MISGKITQTGSINGKITAGSGTTDHSRLVNRDLENQHPIEAITGLAAELEKKLDAQTAMPLINEALKNKAKGLYYDAMKELSTKAYWYLTSEIDPVTKQGTKASIISGPYDLGQGGGGGGGVTIVSISKVGWPSTVVVGSQSSIKINWSSVRGEEKEPTGNGTLYLIVNEKQVEVKTNQPQGQVEFNLTNYLVAGSNSIQIKVLDAYGTTGITVGTINAITLELKSNFNYKLNYPIYGTTGINYTYIPYGDVEKTIYFKIDGAIVGTRVVKSTGEQQTYHINELSHGEHSLEVYFTATVAGALVESSHLYYALIYHISGDKTPIIASQFNKLEQEQYITFNIPYRVFIEDKNEFDVDLCVNDEIVKHVKVGSGEQLWEYYNNTPGNYILAIKCQSIKKEFSIHIKESEIHVEPVTQNLALALSTQGRSNTEPIAERAKWEDTTRGISCNLTNFNWSSDGWVKDTNNNTILRLTGDARVTIPYEPFKNDFRSSGKTIEIELATSTVRDYSATIIKCFDGSRGFYITPQIAGLKSQQSEISTQYKEDDHVRIAFVVEKNTDNRIIWMYINGIASGACQYPVDDSFRQLEPQIISLGSNDATLDIYNIRIYDNNLTSKQVVNNWIADTQNGSEKAIRAIRNDNYNDNNEIVISKLPSSLPYIIWDINPLPQYKGDKRLGNVRYVETSDTTRNFTSQNATYNVQGTSSSVYPTKNIRIKYKANKDYPELPFTWYDDNGDTIKKFKITKDGLGDNYFTYKVDFASSEGANNVELTKLYNDASKVDSIFTPPQRQDAKVRVGIDGYPIVAFHKDESGKEIFCTKANFNNDKANEDVYGFDGAYNEEQTIWVGDESWEITNNTADEAKFKVPVTLENFANAFEIRFPDEDGYNKLDKLGPMTAWVSSTYQDNATESALENPITFTYEEVVRAEDGSYSRITKSETFTNDTKRYRLIKFKAELSNWFDVKSTLFYYIYTHLFLMIDSRAKNAFPTYFKSRVTGDGGDKWFWLPYDMDTAIGIDNKGKLSFDYNLEDIDKIAGADVFNGQDSVMWNNLREAFDGEIGEMYSILRTQGLISYAEVEKRFEDHQNQWSENIFNEDAKEKYIKPLATGDNYLEMLQGGKIEQRKWWLYNRFKYMDSKYTAGDAKADFIQFRAYVESGIDKPNITITPYADIYATVSYANGAAGTKQKRATRNVPITIENPFKKEEAETDQETYIYSASQLKSIGDISAFKPDTVKVGNAIKLQSLKVGDSSETYTNPHLTELTLGGNTLLKTLDARNCINLKQAIDVSGCTNIEEIYFSGTQITGINLPNGGILKHLHLPATLTKLTLKNQPMLTDLQLASTENIESLWLENIPSSVIDTMSMVLSLKDNSAVRLIGINEANLTEAQISTIYNKLDLLRGLDSEGEVISKPQITGTIHTQTISYANYIDFTSRYPEVTIIADQSICSVKFMNEGTLFASQSVIKGTDAANPGIPQKESTQKYYYTFKEWDKSYKNVQTDLIINAIYDEHIQVYTVKYNTQSTQIKIDKYEENAAYGSKVTAPNIIEIPEHVILIDWFKPDNSAWDFNSDTVVDNIELKAKWQDDSKPTIKLSRETFNKFSYVCTDNVGITAWAVTRTNMEPLEWTIIQPIAIFTGTYTINDFGDYYFWVKDAQNNITNSKIISRKLTRELSDGAECIITEDGIEISTFALNNTEILISASIDEHYENLRIYLDDTEIISGSKHTISKDVKIVAQCEPKKYEVSFNTMGKGKAIESQYIAYKSKATKPIGQYSSGYVIDSWYKESALVNEWKFNEDIVLGETTLYAKWIPYKSPSKITIKIDEDNTEIKLNYYQESAKRVDVIWNYNEPESQWETISTYTYPELVELSHIYAKAGTYIISVTAIEGICQLGNNYEKRAIMPISCVTSIEFAWDMPYTRNYAFMESSISSLNLTEYTIAVSISAFSACLNLTSLTLPDSIIEIRDQAFQGCKNISGTIKLPKELAGIGNYVFADCEKINNIIFNDKLSYIGKYDFSNCYALSELNIPLNIVEIQDYAFKSCASLIEAVIPASVSTLGSGVFQYCFALEKVKLLNSALTLDINCFASTNLKSAGNTDDCDIVFTWTNGIPDNAFTNANSLTSVVIPQSFKYIGYQAFYGSGITSIDIPFSITNIGINAFANTPIRSATIRAISSETKINIPQDSWFYDVNSQAKIYIDSSLSTTSYEVFGEYWDNYSEDGKLFWGPIE